MSNIRRTILLAFLLLASLPALAVERDLNAELINAAREGRIAMVRALLAEGADVNARNPSGKTPLMGAAYFGN